VFKASMGYTVRPCFEYIHTHTHTYTQTHTHTYTHTHTNKFIQLSAMQLLRKIFLSDKMDQMKYNSGKGYLSYHLFVRTKEEPK
jgi:hypothetical protein